MFKKSLVPIVLGLVVHSNLVMAQGDVCSLIRQKETQIAQKQKQLDSVRSQLVQLDQHLSAAMRESNSRSTIVVPVQYVSVGTAVVGSAIFGFLLFGEYIGSKLDYVPKSHTREYVRYGLGLALSLGGSAAVYLGARHWLELSLAEVEKISLSVHAQQAVVDEMRAELAKDQDELETLRERASCYTIR